MPDIGASMLARGLSGLIMHGQCRGIDGLYVLQPGHVHAVGGWCPDSLFDVTVKNCKYRQAANAFAQVDVAWDELLDDYENVLRGRQIMTMPPAVFDLPPETHRQTIVQGP
jgi:hypothetical protein